MKNNFDKDLLKIINHYRVLPQLKYFQSEVFELNEAIINYEQEQNLKEILDIKVIDSNISKKQHITEEISDVLVMLSQFPLYYHKLLDDLNVEPYYFKTDNHEHIDDILNYLKSFQQNIFDFNCSVVILEEREQDYIIKYQYENIISKVNVIIYKLISIKEYYKIDNNDILKIMNSKIKRQLDRIESENK